MNKNPHETLTQIHRALGASNLGIGFPALAIGGSIALPTYDPKPFILWGQSHPTLDLDAPETWPDDTEPPGTAILSETLHVPLTFEGAGGFIATTDVRLTFNALMHDPNVVEKTTTAIYRLYADWKAAHAPQEDDPTDPEPHSLRLAGGSD